MSAWIRRAFAGPRSCAWLYRATTRIYLQQWHCSSRENSSVPVYDATRLCYRPWRLLTSGCRWHPSLPPSISLIDPCSPGWHLVAPEWYRFFDDPQPLHHFSNLTQFLSDHKFLPLLSLNSTRSPTCTHSVSSSVTTIIENYTSHFERWTEIFRHHCR